MSTRTSGTERHTGTRVLGVQKVCAGNQKAIPDYDSTVDAQQPEWRELAECAGEDPDLFFPTGTTGRAVQDIRDAKEVCMRCRIRRACGDYALETRQEFGIWGGVTEQEREAIIRKARRAAQKSGRQTLASAA